MPYEKRVPVVTAFVCSGDRIALVKRSDRVRTYKGKWAGFSGYIERIPLNQAWQELQEEAGISRDQVHLRGIGIPLRVDDGDNRWLAFPFLFELADGVEITADWEASEWAWHSPDDLGSLDAVPGLADALESVWPPFGDRQFWDGLAEVATDTTSGATELARRAAVALGGYVQACYSCVDRPELLRAIRAFAACRPVMGVFPDLATRLILATERELGLNRFDDLIEEMLSAVSDATELSSTTAGDLLEGKRRIFTLSHSEAVRNTILRWYMEDYEVFVAESSPAFEGAELARILHEKGVTARVVPDSDIRKAVCSADAVLVGCDAITDEDEIINKIGTREAVEFARESDTPAYAVAQLFKITPPGWPVCLERQTPADLDPDAEETSGEYIYDRTPLDLFEAVFTEEGPLTRARLDEIRAELALARLIP